MSEEIQLLLRNIGEPVAILAGGYIGIRILIGIIRKSLMRSKMDEAHYAFILTTLRVLLWIVVIATALGNLGLPYSTFVAVLGTAGAAIALALRDSLTNFVGGVQILFSKPFLKGDFIENLEISGKVEEINMLYTTLKSYDNRVITIPNGRLSNGTVINHTREQQRRIDLTFRIQSGEAIERVRDILEALAEAEPRILKEPQPFFGVAGQQEGFLLLEFQVWCQTSDYWDIRYRFLELTDLAFREAGIRADTPCMDVRIRK